MLVALVAIGLSCGHEQPPPTKLVFGDVTLDNRGLVIAGERKVTVDSLGLSVEGKNDTVEVRDNQVVIEGGVTKHERATLGSSALWLVGDSSKAAGQDCPRVTLTAQTPTADFRIEGAKGTVIVSADDKEASVHATAPDGDAVLTTERH